MLPQSSARLERATEKVNSDAVKLQTFHTPQIHTHRLNTTQHPSFRSILLLAVGGWLSW
jgi:hypothetical protein